MKLKKGDLGVLVIMFLLMLGVLIAIIWKFNSNMEKCDEAMGYECSASQIIQYQE